MPWQNRAGALAGLAAAVAAGTLVAARFTPHGGERMTTGIAAAPRAATRGLAPTDHAPREPARRELASFAAG